MEIWHQFLQLNFILDIKKTSCLRCFLRKYEVSFVVAGAGFEPTTFGL